MKTTDEPVIVEQFFNKSIEKVWNAITEIDQMKEWFFNNIEAFEPKVGFETQFVVRNEDRIFTHLWKITEAIPNQRLTYNWKYEEYPGDSFVAFELIDENQRVKLRLTHNVVEKFPEGIPEFSHESGVEGWSYFIKGTLKTYLETSSK